MGLTIHYGLKSNVRSAKRARQLVEALHECAGELPFKSVSPMIELIGPACDFQQCAKTDPNRWLLIQASGSVRRGRYSYPIAPTHVIAFDTQPGEGSEPANFGLCRFPGTIEIEDRDVWPVAKRKIRTGLPGWRWGSFCKTQYASDPNCGGVPNFLRCHLLVVRLLDKAKEVGILDGVNDEGDFWEKRDPQALVRQVGEWNEMIAAHAGKLKDMVGPELQAAILAFPNFEHLEAKGRKGG